MRFADPSQYIMDEPDKGVFRVHLSLIHISEPTRPY